MHKQVDSKTERFEKITQLIKNNLVRRNRNPEGKGTVNIDTVSSVYPVLRKSLSSSSLASPSSLLSPLTFIIRVTPLAWPFSLKLKARAWAPATIASPHILVYAKPLLG